MKPSTDPRAPKDWVTSQLRNSPASTLEADQRRGWSDRRRRLWWSILYGSFNPRRRVPRRLNDTRFQFLDWHATHLLAVAIGISLLSVADAFITLTLMESGAIEVNPIMAAVVYKSAAVFTTVKMGLTGVGVISMVFLARYRFMRIIRVELVLYAILVAYVVLIGYECWLLHILSG
jgi:hypothetical protein